MRDRTFRRRWAAFAGQLSDGSIVAAAADWRPNVRASDTFLVVVRVAPDGTVLDDGDRISLPSGGFELQDLRVLDDDTIVVVGYGFNGPDRSDVVAVVIRPSGEVTVSSGAKPEDACDTSPRSARVRPDGGVVAAWEGCEEPFPDILQRFELDADDELSEVGAPFETLTFDGENTVHAQEMSLTDDGDIFIAGFVREVEVEVEDRSARGIEGKSAVQRWTETGGRVLTYGDEGTVFIVDDFLDGLDVNDEGRAVVALIGDEDEWPFLSFTPSGAPDQRFGATARGVPAGDGRVDLVDDELCCEGANSVTIQDDGKVLALKAIDTDSSGIDPTIVARLQRDGTLDPGFGGDGVRVFDFGDQYRLFTAGDLVFQSDGRIIVPLTAEFFGQRAARIGPPADRGASIGLFRLGGTTPDTTTTTPLPPPAGTAAPQTAAAPSLAITPRTCRSRRQFRIRLRTGRRKAERSPIVAAVVRVNGRRVRVTRRARRTASVNLTRLPRGRFTVTIRLRLGDGGIVRETRRYRTCTKKIERELGPLRTRAPRRR